MSGTKSRCLGWEGLQRAELVLLQHPDGTDTRHVAKMTGYAVSSAAKALVQLSQVGKAVHLRGQNGQCTWWHQNYKRTMWERQAAAARDRLPQNKRRMEERHARFLSFEDDPVHRIVPAATASRLRPAGPNSVWGLAA